MMEERRSSVVGSFDCIQNLKMALDQKEEVGEGSVDLVMALMVVDKLGIPFSKRGQGLVGNFERWFSRILSSCFDKKETTMPGRESKRYLQKVRREQALPEPSP